MTPDQQDRLVRAERLLAAAQAFKAELDRDRSLSKREIRRLAIKSVVVVLVTFGLGVFAGALFSGCASAPSYDATDWLARGPAVCRVVPATAITPCRIQLETDADGRVWIDAGGCERPEELRDLAELLVYLASEAR